MLPVNGQLGTQPTLWLLYQLSKHTNRLQLIINVCCEAIGIRWARLYGDFREVCNLCCVVHPPPRRQQRARAHSSVRQKVVLQTKAASGVLKASHTENGTSFPTNSSHMAALDEALVDRIDQALADLLPRSADHHLQQLSPADSERRML